jgi:hypothetical protein
VKVSPSAHASSSASASASALAFAAAFALACSACGSPQKKDDAPVGITEGAATIGHAVSFSFDSLDERNVSSEAAHGRITVLAFITTWDLSSQAEVDYLVAMAKHDESNVFYALVALDDRKNRELVEAYRKTLNVTFPVAMADTETIGGRGPIPGVNQVPTVVVIDRDGRVVWQKSGVSKPDEIRPHMR